ncbi:MAG: hypothetical protein KDA22_13000 [Phycisphaerales bacterium]|nr:hypothetical protein [Phycisphaerales bacterium]
MTAACILAGALAIALATLGCQTGPSPATQPLSGLQTSGSRIGPGQLTLEEIQSSVDAYADRFVNGLAQACNTAAREHPDARNALHAIKLAAATGTYTIAAGPSPVVSVIDLIVQVTLLRHSLGANLVPRQLNGQGQNLLEVLARYEEEAWAMGARVLTEQQRVELRGLIDDWIAQNPGQSYVASVRFSDFARLRTTETRRAASVLSLLRLDPFASIDPATREIEESRLLAERIFFFAERMPQLVAWRMEQLHYTIMSSREIEGLLADIDEFTKTSNDMQRTVEELLTLIPKQTTEAIAQLDDAVTRQREATMNQIASHEQGLSALIDKSNATIDRVAALNGEIRGTLSQVSGIEQSLRGTSEAVRDAGTAWEGTINAFQRTADTMMSASAETGSAVAADHVTFDDVSRSIEQVQEAATELRLLFQEFDSTTQSDAFERHVSASVDRMRGAMTDIVNQVTLRAILVILVLFATMLAYRIVNARLSRAPATRA